MIIEPGHAMVYKNILSAGDLLAQQLNQFPIRASVNEPCAVGAAENRPSACDSQSGFQPCWRNQVIGRNPAARFGLAC